MKKLSPKQREVITMMREGWRIERETHIWKNVALNNVDYGGWHTFNLNTFFALLNKGLLETKDSEIARLKIYTLTTLGKSITL